MNNLRQLIEKISSILFSTKAASLYILLFAIAIGLATFIENDFGTSAAQKLIFRAKWFEVLLILFSISILVNIKRFNLIKQKKWASLIFHTSILIILLGAAHTRYFGYEGVMHIREGGSSNIIQSAEAYLNLRMVKDDKSYSFSEPLLISSLGKNKFEKTYLCANHQIKIRLNDVVPNPQESMEEDNQGVPIIKMVIAGNQGREEYYVKSGDKLDLGKVKVNFTNEILSGYVNIIFRNDSLLFQYDHDVTQMVMATQTLDTIYSGGYKPLRTRALYTLENGNFVVPEFSKSAKVVSGSKSRKIKNESIIALYGEVEIDNKKESFVINGRKGEEGEYKIFENENYHFGLSYGSKLIQLPFSIGLKDFILDRYPGTDNPSSYASEVTLMDESKKYTRDQRIYMNHVLDYGGYRFFQSSYDPDEKGTILSANYDFIGTWLSYIGYILLTIGLLMIFFMPKTRFSYLQSRLSQLQNQSNIFLIIVFFSLGTIATQAQDSFTPLIPTEHANKLQKMLVQDQSGRFEPFNTLANEVIRKLTKKESLQGLNAEQIFLSMIMDPETWEKNAIIQSSSHPKIISILGKDNSSLAYKDFFNADGSYKLKEAMRVAQTMNPKDQGTFEKALIKLDERLNIANMIFSARLLRILPVEGDLNHTWISPAETMHNAQDSNAIDFNSEFFLAYVSELRHANETKDWTNADKLLQILNDQQQKLTGDILPSSQKISLELFLNKIKPFGKLLLIYALFGLGLLIYFFYSVFNLKADRVKATKIGFWLLCLAFIFHTIGLAFRWYVSGHAPWSNGYESMIYIAWTTVMAGLIFSRKSLGGLVATCVLAATILLVASMSWMDPEITPLVPVLKSYWLTIHVSMEAGSYGFLMLGAVIGMLNLILIALTNHKNIERVKRAITELSIVSEITITGGLIMVSIGTYLGGVWANESWGRYWGWDAKETWALVTVLVYAFILHMRFVPGLKSVLVYNIATLFGFATVIMTYYGVNYYLSGLHSYAAGDPVPIPPQVYITASVLFILAVLASLNYRKKFKEDFII